MSLFRKPKRNVRQRQADSDEEISGQNEVEVDTSIDDIHSTIAKLKEKKAGKKQPKKSVTEAEKEKPTTLLSFDDDLNGDDGEIFRVKKSSQSRKLMKQKKQDKKKEKSDNGNEEDKNGHDQEDYPVENDDLDIKVRDNIPKREDPKSWIVSGREAEALHLEEEDEESEEEDPIQKLLKSGAIPDAAAIHAARKQRQAAREGKGPPNFVPIKSSKKSTQSESPRETDDDDSGNSADEGRLKFSGIKPDKIDLSPQQLELAFDEDGWEEQQIRKAVKNPGLPVEKASDTRQSLSDYGNDNYIFGNRDGEHMPDKLGAPVSYNLEGIKGRLKLRLTSMVEVNRRHESDMDKIVDELVETTKSVEFLETQIPKLTARHRFYQDLRGYVTDLVECFNEKVVSIKYIEDKMLKSRGDITNKIMERRREDVRDQMRECTPVQPGANLDDPGRQRRSAEREGRRRRRQQNRAVNQTYLKIPHYEGMSTDDELPSQEQANVAKVRQDVENQARLVMSDVVEDFSTLNGVVSRFEEWKAEDPDSYGDAYVSICLPKIFSPIIRLNLLFWNPLTDHPNIESMEWYNKLAAFSLDSSGSSDLEEFSKDPDRNLLMLMVEKVLLVKITGIVEASYDPLSSAQTLKLTGLLSRFIEAYPSINGESRQLRDLLTNVKDKFKVCLDQDVYIPLGFQKQNLDNSSSVQSKFLSRQFWGAFKLMKNIFSWHGILSDKILLDLGVSSLLNRYLVVALTITVDSSDALLKSKFIVSAIPSEWIKSGKYRNEFQRFVQYLTNLKQTARQGPDFLRDISSLIGFLD